MHTERRLHRILWFLWHIVSVSICLLVVLAMGVLYLSDIVEDAIEKHYDLGWPEKSEIES